MTPKQSWVLAVAVALVSFVLGSLAACYHYGISFMELWFE